MQISSNAKLLERIHDAAMFFSSNHARLALSIATCTNGETNFSLAKQF